MHTVVPSKGGSMKKSTILLAPVLGGIVLACTTTTSSLAVVCGPDSVATTNADIVVVTNDEAAFFFASVDAVPLGAGAVASSSNAASMVAAAQGVSFPNGCATATASGNVVTFKLNNCSGPLGLVGATGTFTATLTLVNNAVQIQLAGNDISANGGTLNLAASGTVTATGGQKTLAATTRSSGTGPNGNNVAHTGMFTLVWPTGTGCATINATLSGIGSGSFSGTSTRITNLVACVNRCPQSGTAISSFNGGSATLTFNGSTDAQCSASDGTSAGIALNCP